MLGAENRIHARIHVSTQIEVSSPDGMIEAELKDLSKGGARFLCSQRVGAVGDTLELFLPSIDGSEIAVMAQVIRSEPSDGKEMVAVRFDAVEPSMAQGLADLIELLLQTSVDPRGADLARRAARRIELHFQQLPELRGILQDIARGALLMTLPEPLALYEDVEVAVPDMAGQELLILRARVAHQRKTQKDERTVYQVGLEFNDLRSEARRCVGELLRAVLEVLDEPVPPDGG